MTEPTSTPPVVEPRDVALRMRLDYSHGAMDHAMKIVDEIGLLCTKAKQPKLDIDALLQEAANLIPRLFGILNTSVAIWDEKKGCFCYRVFSGFDKETIDAYRKISYSREHVANEKTYPSHEISKSTRLYLSEDHPYANGEESSYARPTLLGMKRHAISDSLEGDYLCFFFHGRNNEVIGWIETSGTRLRKLPDTQAIKWIELIACILGTFISMKS